MLRLTTLKKGLDVQPLLKPERHQRRHPEDIFPHTTSRRPLRSMVLSGSAAVRWRHVRLHPLVHLLRKRTCGALVPHASAMHSSAHACLTVSLRSKPSSLTPLQDLYRMAQMQAFTPSKAAVVTMVRSRPVPSACPVASTMRRD